MLSILFYLLKKKLTSFKKEKWFWITYGDTTSCILNWNVPISVLSSEVLRRHWTISGRRSILRALCEKDYVAQYTLIISAWVFNIEAGKAPMCNLVSPYFIMLYENNMFALPFYSPQVHSILE